MAKDDLPVDKIKQLAELLKDQDLTEIELEADNFKIKVRKEISISAPVAAASSSPAAVAPTATPAASAESFIEIKSPMVGTFYSSPSPDADPFIKVGDSVKKGQTVCIVEAMKLMNELPSEVEGEVVEICVANGEAVSFGQVIAKLK